MRGQRWGVTLGLTLGLTLPAWAARADDPLLLKRPDLHAHAWASFGMALVLTEVLEGPEPAWGPGWGTGWATLTATGVVGLIGVVKELTDDQVTGSDLVADAVGLLANVVLQYSLAF
ncbi:MAG: hypothetical protein KC613_17515 [Myxococcales bacterium]|nr:hypothetical protein [Myxococcales bacterium]MCB9525101.1 hypothetical protein [Myxococcales bacterium]